MFPNIPRVFFKKLSNLCHSQRDGEITISKKLTHVTLNICTLNMLLTWLTFGTLIVVNLIQPHVNLTMVISGQSFMV